MEKNKFDRSYRYFLIFCIVTTFIINSFELFLETIYHPTLKLIDNIITVSFFSVSALEFLLLYSDTKKQSYLATSLLFVGFTILIIKIIFF